MAPATRLAAISTAAFGAVRRAFAATPASARLSRLTRPSAFTLRTVHGKRDGHVNAGLRYRSPRTGIRFFADCADQAHS